jgi:hypothetical protein
MPTVTCPGCQKQYKLPDTAAGQVASCKCGKKFRIAAPAPAAAATKASTASATAVAPKSPAAVASPPKPAPAIQKTTPTDDFWDKALSEPVAVEAPPWPKPAPAIGSRSYTAPPDRRRRPADEVKKQKTKPKVRWGFDWGKVGAGLLTFLIAGGIDLFLVMSVGRLNIWLAVVAVGGLITCLNGLMGEEGVW